MFTDDGHFRCCCWSYNVRMGREEKDRMGWSNNKDRLKFAFWVKKGPWVAGHRFTQPSILALAELCTWVHLLPEANLLEQFRRIMSSFSRGRPWDGNLNLIEAASLASLALPPRLWFISQSKTASWIDWSRPFTHLSRLHRPCKLVYVGRAHCCLNNLNQLTGTVKSGRVSERSTLVDPGGILWWSCRCKYVEMIIDRVS